MNEALERRLTDLLEGGDLDAAATEALRGYGPNVMRFLMTRTQDEDRAAEAFSQMSEDLWQGLASFRRECSFLTWMFALARNAAQRDARRPHNRPERHETLSRLDAIAADVRRTTAAYLRTDVKERFRLIRASLSDEERTLLHLRIDQEMKWEDVARIMSDGAPLDAESSRRAAVRLRKQFNRLRQKLRRRAETEGILEPRE